MKEIIRERELGYYDRVHAMGQTSVGQVIYRHLDTQNDKSAAILTYLSLMSAVCATLIVLLLQVNALAIFIAILSVVLIAFISLATVSLRTIMVTSPSASKIDAEEHMRRLTDIARSRRRAHNFVIKISMFISVVLVAGILAFAAKSGISAFANG